MNAVGEKISRIPKKVLVLGIALCLLLLSGALYVSTKNTPVDDSARQAKLMRQDKINYETAIAQAHMQRRERNTAGAIQVLEDYLKVARANDNKIFTYTKIGTFYEVQKDYSKAIEAYRNAEKLKGRDDRAITVGIARSSHKLGDKKTAIEYYKKSVAVLEAENSRTFTEDIALYKQTIASIEAGR